MNREEELSLKGKVILTELIIEATKYADKEHIFDLDKYFESLLALVKKAGYVRLATNQGLPESQTGGEGMTREEAIELFVATVRDGNPGCFACKERNDRDKCARCVIKNLLKDLPFLAVVDRKAKLPENPYQNTEYSCISFRVWNEILDKFKGWVKELNGKERET